MGLILPELPYAMDALVPHMSKETLKYHYGKHHKGYVDKTNQLAEGRELRNDTLEDFIRGASDGDRELYNNAAQVWNHTFFWEGMRPDGGGTPDRRTAEALTAAFDGLDGFKDAFAEAATGHFGSGWAWLVAKGDALEVLSTSNAQAPFARGMQPLLTCDLWEHAYYLDYQNERDRFVDAFLEHLVNWEIVAQRLEAIRRRPDRSAA